MVEIGQRMTVVNQQLMLKSLRNVCNNEKNIMQDFMKEGIIADGLVHDSNFPTIDRELLKE